MATTKSKIYTKTGDSGKTSLFGGKRISKDDLRIEAIGTIDELNAILGTAISFAKDAKLSIVIKKIQNELFNIGAELANPQKVFRATIPLIKLDKEEVTLLETIIDQYDKNLPTLKTFILPSGANLAVLFHLARSITRRAERRVVSLSKRRKVKPNCDNE